nr:hypothetical protein [Occultella gossypii]
MTRCYRYDLDLDETLRRHRTKPLAAEVTEDSVRSWYRAADPVHGLDESNPGAEDCTLYGPQWPGNVGGPPGPQTLWVPLRSSENASRIWTVSEQLTGVAFE